MKSKPNLFRSFSKFTLVPSFAVISLFLGGSTFATVWDGTGTVVTDWNDNGNWVGNAGTGGSAAVININSPVATISANIVATPNDILVGEAAGTNGRVDHIAGTAQTGNGNWLKIGQNGGTGVYNLANTAGTGGTYTGFGQGSGSFTVTGNAQLRVGGGDAGSGSTGTMNVNTSGTFTVGSELHVGTQTSTGTLNIDNGAVNVGNWVYIGDGGAGGSGVTGTLKMSGGTLTKTGGNNFRIGSGGAKGFATISGGTLTNNNEFQIGDGAGTQGTLTLSNGTINTGSWVSIGRSTGTGTVTVSGGILTKTNVVTSFIVGDGSTGTLTQTNGAINTTGQFWVASNTSTGVYNMSGGTLSADDWFVVGRNGGSSGTINMTGGTINKGGANDLVVGGDSATANGTITFSGGIINVTGGVTNIGKNAGVGTLTMSGTSDFRTAQMIVGVGTGVGTVNFDGGTLKTPKLNGGAGSSTFHFNGGTLLATADSPTFVSGLGTADILAGGALIDTQAFTDTASQIFTGTGTLTKLGSGTLTLTGDSTHTGLTQVSDGKLVVNTRSTFAAGGFSVANGKTLGVTRRSGEESLYADSLTLGTTAATATLEMNLGNFGNPTSGVATLYVVGALTVNANTTINVTDSFPEVGSFPLIQFGSRTGSGSLTLGSLPPGMVAHLDETIDPNAIYLVITQAQLLEWDDSELTGGVWNTSNFNWNDVLTFAPAVFTTGAPVSFLDIGTVDSTNPPNPNVVIAAGGVSPGAVTFNNSLLNYSITGAGGMNGAASVLKQGTGSVTIGTTNAYTGATRIEGGILSVGSIANGGTPSGIGASPASAVNLVFAGGTLSYTGPGATSDRGFSIAAANSVFDVQAALTLSGPVNASAGGLVKSGAGVLTLSHPGANILATGGNLTIDQGGVVLSGGGTQTNSVTADLFVGTALAATSDLTLNNTALTCTGYLAIARGSGTPGAVSTCTLTTGSTVTTANLSLGYDNGVAGYSATSLLTLDSSSFTTGYNKIAESNGATGTVVLNGSSTMTAGNTDVAQGNGSTGTLNIKGTSVYTSNNRIQVGRDGGSIGTVTIENSGSLIANSYVSVGYNGGGAITVKNSGSLTIASDFSVNENGITPANATLQDTGTITVGGTTYIGRNSGRVGTFTQTGGTHTGNGGEFQIGKYGSGTWLQSAGITNAGGWVSIARETGSTGILTVSGTGTFNQTGTGNGLVIGENGSGTLNIQGSATVASSGTGGVVITRAGGSATVNLDGGTFVAVKVVDDGGSSTFNFNGGVLKAGAGAAATFLTGIDIAMVKVGGAKIDSNGNDIALNQNFTNDTSSGNFTKTGAGTLFVNGNVGILGQAHISAGTISGTGNFICPLFVDGTSNLNPGGATPGTLTANATTFAATSSMTIDLAATQDALLTGALVLNGATLALNGTATQPVYVIAQYTSLPGGSTGKFAGGMSPPALPSGYTIDYAYNGGTQIALVQTATPYTTWAAANITAINPSADATPNGNPDNDGLTNLAEFGLNGNPMSGASSGKVVSRVANVGGVPSLVLTLPVRTVATFTSGANNEQNSNLVSGLVYTIEGSNALATWNIPVSEVTGGDKTAIELPLVTGNPADSGWSYRTFTTGPVSGSSKKFLRAVIKQP